MVGDPFLGLVIDGVRAKGARYARAPYWTTLEPFPSSRRIGRQVVGVKGGTKCRRLRRSPTLDTVVLVATIAMTRGEAGLEMGRSNRRFHRAAMRTGGSIHSTLQSHMAPYGTSTDQTIRDGKARYERWREEQAAARRTAAATDKNDPPPLLDVGEASGGGST